MGSELDIIATDVDIDGFVTAARAAALLDTELSVVIREEPFEGRVQTIWGRRLDPENADLWQEAREEVESGQASIETIAPGDGRTPFDAVVYFSPYRAAVLESLQRDGEPTFRYASSFVTVEFTWGAIGRLILGFDRASRATGRLDGLVPGPRPATRISTCDEYAGRDHNHATAADHMRAVRLVDLLAQYSIVTICDTTDYYAQREEIPLIAAMALDRQFRADLRNLFAPPPALPEYAWEQILSGLDG